MTHASTKLAYPPISSITSSQPGPDAHVTSIDLSRAVFDEMMDRDLLGFLLSSSHLHKFLAAFSTYAGQDHAQALRRYLTNVDSVHQFHQITLKMFSGAFIAETAIESRTELMAILDKKHADYIKELGIQEDVHYETSLQELESVELAWKYRNVCGNGKPTPFDL